MHEFAQEQRVAGRRLVAAGAEGVIGIGREPLAQQPRRRRTGQGGRPNDGGERIREDLRQESWILSLVRP